jgi:predicted MPP superfamily phosphohydrolase
MPICGLPDEMVGLKIVQVSDLHYSPVVWGSYLEQYVQWINELKPAVVTATGDLYMGGRRYAEKVADLLSKLKPTHGVLCIMGNHDYGVSGKAGSTAGPRRAAHLAQAIERRGMRMLRNQSWSIASSSGQKLTFVGLDEQWAGLMCPETGFAGLTSNDPVVCLVHNPACCLDLLEYPWQWMLTGHTHGRQLATSPVGQRLYPGRYRRFTHGLYRVNGRYLYVNRGLSYGQRGREWCRPEITVFELQRADTGRAVA